MKSFGTLAMVLFFALLFGACGVMAYRGVGVQEIGQPNVRAGSVVGPVIVGGGPRTGK